MCVVKTPKIAAPTTQADKEKPLQVLRNPLLDGIQGNINSLRIGRSSLRVDRTTGSTAGVQMALNPMTPQIGAVT